MIDGPQGDGEKRVFAEALRQATQDYEELVGELSILKLLNDSLQVGIGFNDICRKLVQFLTEAMNIENASIMRFDPEREELKLLTAKSIYEDEGAVYDKTVWSGKVFRLGEGLAGQVAEERRSILIRDTLDDPRFVSAKGQNVEIRSVICLPLIQGDRLHGVLNLSNSEPGAFDLKKQHALNIIASTTSVALSQAIAVDELKQLNGELTARNRELGAVIALSESLHSNLDLDPVLAESLKNISDGFDVEAAAIFIKDSETGAMKMRSHTALPTIPDAKHLLQMVSKRHGSEIVRCGGAGLYVGSADTVLPERDCRPKQHSCIGVPLLSGEDCFGMLIILSADETAFGEAKLKLLGSFCKQISVAIHNSILVSRLKDNIAELKETRHRLIQADKLALLGEMVSGVAHEINNPLAAIMGYSELLLEDESIHENGKTMLTRTVACVDRCRKIVQGLLSFARKTELEKKPANLNEIVDRVLTHRDYDLTGNNIEVIKNYEVDEPVAVVDPNQMEQVFLNLLNNAIDSMVGRDVPGILEIRTCRIDEGMMQIEFIDNGSGVKDADRARLFEPFFTTKEVGKGTGLGLSVSYGIVKEHDGNLYLDDAHYCGAKFVVILPLAVNGSAAEQATRQKGPLTWPKAQGRILVVDDEYVVADVIETVLSSRGFLVECASNGEEAYRMMDSNEYDLVISDIKMPGSMDGRRLFYETTERCPEMAERFVFISGDVMEKKTAEFLNECGRAFLLKPFSLNDLQEVIEKTLENTRH
jgi:two-component system NtrC family sensor kinase